MSIENILKSCSDQKSNFTTEKSALKFLIFYPSARWWWCMWFQRDWVPITWRLSWIVRCRWRKGDNRVQRAVDPLKAPGNVAESRNLLEMFLTIVTNSSLFKIKASFPQNLALRLNSSVMMDDVNFLNVSDATNILPSPPPSGDKWWPVPMVGIISYLSFVSYADLPQPSGCDLLSYAVGFYIYLLRRTFWCVVSLIIIQPHKVGYK